MVLATRPPETNKVSSCYLTTKKETIMDDRRKKGEFVGALGALLVHVAVIALLILVSFTVPQPDEDAGGVPVMLGMWSLPEALTTLRWWTWIYCPKNRKHLHLRKRSRNCPRNRIC